MKEWIIKFIFGIFSLPFILHSCRKPILAFGVENPVENLPWLRDELFNYLEVYAYQCYCAESEYIVIADPPGPDSVTKDYHCLGTFLCIDGGFIPGNNPLYNVPIDFWKVYSKKDIKYIKKPKLK